MITRSGQTLVCLLTAFGGLAHASPVIADETSVNRGDYLVNALAACAGCHTPKSDAGLGPLLSGGTTFGSGDTSVYAANITPDTKNGIGTWTDQQIIDAVRNSVRPDGSHIRPPMPQTAYRGISDTDIQSVVAYLRSVEAVSHLVPCLDRPKPVDTSRPLFVTSVVATASSTDIERGQYIVKALTHCAECHTPVFSSLSDFKAHINEGGRVFQTPNGSVVAPSITGESLKRYTDEELANIITKGLRSDGSSLKGPMPIAAYSKIRPTDLTAIIAYLLST